MKMGPSKIEKDGDDMTYDELEVGMNLIVDRTDGTKKLATVVRICDF